MKPCQSAHTPGTSSTTHRVTVLNPHTPRLQPIHPPHPATLASNPSSWFLQRAARPLTPRSSHLLLQPPPSHRALPEMKGLGSSRIQLTGPSTACPGVCIPTPALPCSVSQEVSRENSPSPLPTPHPLPDSKPPAFCFFPRTETTRARGTEDPCPTKPRGPLHP